MSIPATPMPSAPTRWPFLLALSLLTALGLLPVWLAALPPLQDYPQHLFNVAVLLDPPGGPLSQHYVGEWHLGPYTSIYALIALLTPLFGLEAAGRLTLSLVGVATALAIAAADRHLRRSAPTPTLPRYGLLLWVPLTFTQCWYLGLVNWCLAVPLLVWALLQHTDATSEHPPRRWWLGHAAVVLLLNLTHPFAGLAYAGLAALASLWRPLPALVRRRGLLLAATALATTVALLLAAGLGGPAVQHQFVPPSLEFAAIFALMPAVGMLGARGFDAVPLAAWLGVLVVLAMAARTQPAPLQPPTWRDRLWWALLAATALAYLVLPQADVGIQYFYLNLRLIALVYALLAVLAGRLELAPRSAIVLVALVAGLTLHGAVKQWRLGDEIGEVLPLVDKIPSKSRLLPLMADPTSPELQPQMFQPHIHAGYYHPIRHRAGFVPYVFGTALNPVHVRPGAERPAPPQTQPGKFRTAEHWADYEFALVRAPNPKLLQRLLKQSRVAGQSGAWLLLQHAVTPTTAP